MNELGKTIMDKRSIPDEPVSAPRLLDEQMKVIERLTAKISDLQTRVRGSRPELCDDSSVRPPACMIEAMNIALTGMERLEKMVDELLRLL